MQIIIRKQPDGLRTIYGKRTKRNEKSSSWHYDIPKEQVARVVEAVRDEMLGVAPG